MKKYIENKESYQKLLKAPYQLIAVMTLMVVLISTISIYRLYHIGFQEQKKRLIEIVKSEAIMINIMAKHEMDDHKYSKKDIENEVLDNLVHVHNQFSGFGETGEYTLAKLNGDKISFLLRHRHQNLNRMNSISISSKLAEPMRRALNGKSGSLIGLDYRGEKVLAAHEPIPSLGWGVVAKIDIDEIRAPYIQEAIYAMVGGLVLIVIGSLLVIEFIQPLTNEIESSRQYNRTLFNETPIGLALTDFNGKMIDVNPAFLELTGYTEAEVLELSYWDLTPRKYEAQEQEQLKLLIKYDCYGPYEKEYIHKNGQLINVRLYGCVIENNNERYIWSSVEDITRQKHDELALKEASLVFENTHEGIMITDENTKITKINRQFTRITGYTIDEIIGKNPSFLQSGAHDSEFYKEMWNKIHTTGSWYGELNNRRKNGEYFATLQSINAVKNEDGDISGYVSVFSDISERKRNELRLAHLASHDALTSLPNRMHFHDNLEQAIYVAKRNNQNLAVLFLDLNDFKIVNDTLGHKVGDALLQEIAKRLKASIREEDTVARLGGDEFAIVLHELKNSDDAIEVAKKIIEKVKENLKIGSYNLTPSTSIGISMYPEHAKDGDTLVKLADDAMYIAKQKGKDRYELYS